MSRLISMEDAIRAIEEEWDGCCSEYPATQIIYDTTEAIERLPIIQPRRGKRNRLGMDALNCNRCGATFVINQGGEKMHFCPNCGADMRGEQDDSV